MSFSRHEHYTEVVSSTHFQKLLAGVAIHITSKNTSEITKPATCTIPVGLQSTTRRCSVRYDIMRRSLRLLNRVSSSSVAICKSKAHMQLSTPFSRYWHIKLENSLFSPPHPCLTPLLGGISHYFMDESCPAKTRGWQLLYGETAWS